MWIDVQLERDRVSPQRTGEEQAMFDWDRRIIGGVPEESRGRCRINVALQ